MGAVATTTLVSVEEYLRNTDKPTCEYRDGVLFPKPMATFLHGLIALRLMMLLNRQGLISAPEVAVRLSPARYLVPDVIGTLKVQHPYPTEPVLLCCEVLSPDDRLGATFAKCDEYHAWGVPFCWVVDPVKRTAWEYHRATGEPVRVAEALHAGDYTVALPELFSAIEGK
ncbi:MAG: Uma2 family endonuclease [Bryobacterales bacterium]|nr:Uma2 family endonuclease [Bryobacterales bacterium]